MNIKRIISFFICLLFVFSGGCLFEVDEELDNAQVIIKYKETEINKKTVTRWMEAILAAQGTNLAEIKETDYWTVFREDALRDIAVYEIALDKAAQLGLDKLDEETTAKIDEEIDSLSKMMVESSAKAAVEADPSLNYDEEFVRQFEEYISSLGYTADSFRKEFEREYIFNNIKEYYAKQVTVSDEDVRSDYESNLEIQKSNIENNPDIIETQLQYGSYALFYPEGYKRVKHIFIKYEDDTIINEANEAYASEDTERYRQAVERGMDTIKPKLDEIMEKLNSGESFDDVAEYSIENHGAQKDTKIIGPFSEPDIPDYKEKALALKKEGEYSQPFGTYQGAYIIYCESLLSGEVPYEDVREDLHDSMLLRRQQENWEQMTQEWVEAALADGTLKLYEDRY